MYFLIQHHKGLGLLAPSMIQLRFFGTQLGSRIPSAFPRLKPAGPSMIQDTADDPIANTHQLMVHFSKILTKHGTRGEDVLARVAMELRHKYQHPAPIKLAVDAIKPVLKYQKLKTSKVYTPIVLHPKPSCSIAIRWIVDLAGKRTYVGGRPCLERGLIDEIDAIIQGTSPLYGKKTQFHKNPN